jgi:formylmethanofuran dehydrogenase subunit E
MSGWRDLASIFRQIDTDQVELIQKVVTVDYDNSLQMPLGFQYEGRYHEVIELIGSFREIPDDPTLLYLVRTRDSVYSLYLDLWENRDYQCQWRGQWVLHWRLEEGKEKALLVDMKLKQVGDFHGHLCPDLVIGYRASRYALTHLELLYSPDFRVIVENAGSAVDAVQQLTGCTLGNGRLVVQDYGKHVYTFVYEEGKGLRLAIGSETLPTPPEFLALEEKIKTDQATMLETVRYQVLLDECISTLLEFSDKALFSTRRVAVEWPDKLTTSVLIPCDDCNEPVAASHLVTTRGRQLCQPCAERKIAVPPEES